MIERLVNIEDIDLLLSGRHANPHKCLGILTDREHSSRIILFRPGAHSVTVELQGNMLCAQAHHSGLFSLSVPSGILPDEYRIYHQNGLLAHDPYSFPPLWGKEDSFLFHQGKHTRIYERMGAIPYDLNGIFGVLFVVWAPRAQRVSVVGDFNHWNGLVNPLRRVGEGVWELFIPGLAEGTEYKWEIVTASGEVIVKTDPYGKSFGPPPHGVARVVDSDRYPWTDRQWMENRSRQQPSPISIYEVHVGSWQWGEESPLRYRELAYRLASYCQEMHYTHVELLPITEHPLNESWGYQVTGYYAPTHRYGSPEDFQFFVEYLHNQGIGVILDWVPAHFPTDAFALSAFDGMPLYESIDHPNPLHPHWHTHTFDYHCHEVVNFLLGSALFWLDKMHVDGLRVDAVSSMLYLDYGRQGGEWSPNRYGGKENLDAIAFLQYLNSVIHKEFPGVMTFAEEATDFPGVTRSPCQGGLGFDYKWDLGWMHDTFHYLKTDVGSRDQSHLTFHLWYAFNESYLLPLSHDEVVHGKGCLFDKMFGSRWEKFAHIRLLLSYQVCQPGKKLLFMGNEFALEREWSPDRPLDWHILEDADHKALRHYVSALNALYVRSPYLWGDTSESFLWVDFNDRENHVISYYRYAKDRNSALLCVHHFGTRSFPSYVLHCQDIQECRVLLNSDDARYGGKGYGGRQPILSKEGSRVVGIDFEMPPLATLIFYVTFSYSAS